MITRAQADQMLGNGLRLTLRAGMCVSMALLVLGIAMYLAFDGETGAALGPLQAIEAALAGEAIGFLSLGVLALIATPLAGVIVALGVFLRTHDRRFAGVALAVLGVVALAILVKVLA
ncbi:MAG: DUF1634 domain-containing protein [Methanomassiliicoccales archaeon]|nr:DUF1634 domain-containing protein [Methanomassiliicoccales archaeon]